MTLEEIEDSLPEGLHDSLITSLTQEFVAGTVIMGLNVFVGVEDTRSLYREAELTFDRVLFCSAELPATESAFRHQGRLWILSFVRNSESLSAEFLATLPVDSLCYSIFIHDWLADLHIAAADVQFRWLDGQPLKGTPN